jgi:hypothetical protein
MKHLLWATLGATLLYGLPTGALAQAWDIYLEGYKGPYRGRVVDAETKEPIAGAAVVAVWMRDKVYPFHSTSVFYGAREVLTGKDGQFTIDGRELEQGAPEHTLKPYFNVFSPEFAAYRSRVFVERGFQQGLIFEGTGVTIGLPRLRTRRERLESVVSARPPAVPDEAIPHLVRLIDIASEPLRGAPGRVPPRER